MGNEVIPSRDLSEVIETRATTCRTFLLGPVCWVTDWGFAHNRAYLNDRALGQDLLRLRVYYAERGYRDARVDTLVIRDDGQAEITFTVEEGPPTLVDSLRISGVEETLDTALIRDVIDLAPGAPYDLTKVSAGKSLLTQRLNNRGHIDAIVLEETTLPAGEGARIHLAAEPGTRVRVRDINIEGADEIGDEVVRSFLAFRSGQYYNHGRVLESQRNLTDLNAIRFAAIGRSADRLPGDSAVDINVQVTQAPTRAARAGGGWSTNRCFQTEVRLTHRNFLGHARTLEMTGRLSNIFASLFNGSFPCNDVGQTETFRQLNFSFQTEFIQPWLFSARNNLRTRVFIERASVPDVFVRSGVGGQVAVIRRLRTRMSATISYRPEYTGFDEESADIFFCVNFGFCQREDIALVSQAAWLAPVTVSWIWNKTNDLLSPTRGFYLNADAEVAGKYTGSQWRYVRGALQGAAFRPINDRLTLAVRARTGYVQPTGGLAVADAPETQNDIVNPAKRFFAGGSQSVRGFGQNLLGPTVLVLDSATVCRASESVDECVLRVEFEDQGQFIERPAGGDLLFEFSAELRHRLSEKWGVVAFADLGQVWDDLDELSAPVLTPGAGVRWFSPLGPFRVDIGYNPSGVNRLPLVVQVSDGQLVEFEREIRYDPFTFDDPSLITEIWRRMRFHFSIGEAF